MQHFEKSLMYLYVNAWMHNTVCKERETWQELEVVTKSWKKVYGAHAAYGVHKVYVEQAAYGIHARWVACAARGVHTEYRTHELSGSQSA
jgi:hypothetical protein